MQRAQGKMRSKPDGFLHLQNFAVTRASGMAGALFNYVMSERQREVVETALMERAKKQEDSTGELQWHVKHDTTRFRKEFLVQHFKPVLYGTFKLFRRNASEQMAIEINREYLQVESAKVKWP